LSVVNAVFTMLKT